MHEAAADVAGAPLLQGRRPGDDQTLTVVKLISCKISNFQSWPGMKRLLMLLTGAPLQRVRRAGNGDDSIERICHPSESSQQRILMKLLLTPLERLFRNSGV